MANKYHTLGSVQIPRGMIWQDELTWNPVLTAVEYGLNGAVVIDRYLRNNGRPMTLVGADSYGWISRDTLQALHALAANTAIAQHTFTHADGRVFGVAFAEGNPIEAGSPLGRAELPPTDHPYLSATVRLIVTSGTEGTTP